MHVQACETHKPGHAFSDVYGRFALPGPIGLSLAIAALEGANGARRTVMHAAFVWVGIATFSLGGCAATGGAARSNAANAGTEFSAVRIAETRVLDARVNPMVPVQMAAEGSALAVTFGERGREQVVTRIGPASLDLLSREQSGRSPATAAPSWGATRVALEGGRFLICWTHQNSDGGRQALAQMWAANGAKLGEPVIISPPDADVLGAPRAATTDGRHVLVTFASTSGEGFELRAVSLEDAERPIGSDQMARR
jgi:hypothetical protein